MMGKASFLIHDEWAPMLMMLPDDMAGQIIKALFQYRTERTIPDLEPSLKAIAAMMIGKMDEDEAAYAEACERNRKAVNVRWAKRNDTNVYGRIQLNTNEYGTIRNDTKNTDSDNDNDYIKEKDIPTEYLKRKEKHKYGEYKHVLLTDEEHEKLKTEYGSDKAEKAIEFLDAYIEEKPYKAKSHYLSIRRWVMNAIEEKAAKAVPKAAKAVEPRDYDFDDLERRLMG